MRSIAIGIAMAVLGTASVPAHGQPWRPPAASQRRRRRFAPALPRPREVWRLIAGRGPREPWRAVVGDTAPSPALRFKVDTFAFRNDSRIHHRGKPDLYASWCFVLARAVTQFQRFARFDPDAPRRDSSEYSAVVRSVVALEPWNEPLPAQARIAVPGFASLYEISRDEEQAVKAGLGRRFWTLVHPANWRIVFPSPRWEQERVTMETMAELRAGRPVQFLISDFPRIRLNHSVLVYDYRVTTEDAIEFLVYDPNDPHAPGVIRFDRLIGRFVPAPLCGVDVPSFRAFRIYHAAGC